MSESENQQAESGMAQTAPPAKRAFDDLPPAAQRALKEAEERRMQAKRPTDDLPREINGRGGEDPARYGDWEVKGIAIDF
jgi:hypothetical protein